MFKKTTLAALAALTLSLPGIQATPTFATATQYRPSVGYTEAQKALIAAQKAAATVAPVVQQKVAPAADAKLAVAAKLATAYKNKKAAAAKAKAKAAAKAKDKASTYKVVAGVALADAVLVDALANDGKITSTIGSALSTHADSLIELAQANPVVTGTVLGTAALGATVYGAYKYMTRPATPAIDKSYSDNLSDEEYLNTPTPGALADLEATAAKKAELIAQEQQTEFAKIAAQATAKADAAKIAADEAPYTLNMSKTEKAKQLIKNTLYSGVSYAGKKAIMALAFGLDKLPVNVLMDISIAIKNAINSTAVGKAICDRLPAFPSGKTGTAISLAMTVALYSWIFPTYALPVLAQYGIAIPTSALTSCYEWLQTGGLFGIAAGYVGSGLSYVGDKTGINTGLSIAKDYVNSFFATAPEKCMPKCMPAPMCMSTENMQVSTIVNLPMSMIGGTEEACAHANWLTIFADAIFGNNHCVTTPLA